MLFRSSNANGITGTGVGLYFVKMVVELHGGSVDVESRNGAGSRFTVSLPIRPLSVKHRQGSTRSEELAHESRR